MLSNRFKFFFLIAALFLTTASEAFDNLSNPDRYRVAPRGSNFHVNGPANSLFRGNPVRGLNPAFNTYHPSFNNNYVRPGFVTNPHQSIYLNQPANSFVGPSPFHPTPRPEPFIHHNTPMPPDISITPKPFTPPVSGPSPLVHHMISEPNNISVTPKPFTPPVSGPTPLVHHMIPAPPNNISNIANHGLVPNQNNLVPAQSNLINNNWNHNNLPGNWYNGRGYYYYGYGYNWRNSYWGYNCWGCNSWGNTYINFSFFNFNPYYYNPYYYNPYYYNPYYPYYSYYYYPYYSYYYPYYPVYVPVNYVAVATDYPTTNPVTYNTYNNYYVPNSADYRSNASSAATSTVKWVSSKNGNVPSNAVLYQYKNNKSSYYCRSKLNNKTYYGVLYPNDGCYISTDNNTATIRFEDYQVKIAKDATS